MPAFVGGVEFTNLSDGIFSVGDTFILAPKSINKSTFGAGVLNTGDFLYEESLFSISNFYDNDVMDQNQIINK
ncbi:spore germination protein [Metabacillus fastidiosus]|uniref:spore germination protein n=1 Tax=Metabacillus fastidiosus TaxID=1458 RepID=UPI002E1C5424|nr:spore germination protein [Metabacillus fastidiosus]